MHRLVSGSLLTVILLSVYAGGADSPEKPDIILIMADDLGFSDLGCYGSEISTPHIDGLAAEGLRFSNFYNAARCCPTRAALLTGLYPHEAGLGGMVTRVAAEAEPGPYQGYLTERSVTLAEVLAGDGYTTLMAGKWHVGEEHPQWPMDRGFQDYYGLISGAAHYFDIRQTKEPGMVRHYAKGNEEFLPPAENFYMTDAITDHAVRMLAEKTAEDTPFFLYLAYTAPHWPLHALPEDIEKYRGKYMIGWDKIREQRYQRQLEMDLFGKVFPLSPRDPVVPAWDALDAAKKDEMDLKMAVYAAQIECMDRGIGRVLDQIETMGRAENTLVLFLSDNGGCAEGGVFGRDFWENGIPPGEPGGYHNYGTAWANASNTPFRKYKQYIHEGGISTPLIARWPEVIRKKGAVTHKPGHIIDIMATFCDIAGIRYPDQFKGQPVSPASGKSLLPVFRGKSRNEHEVLCWEHIGSAGIRKGKWKLVAENGQPWELHDLKADRTELDNLISRRPEVARDLHHEWMKWAEACGVRVSAIHKLID